MFKRALIIAIVSFSILAFSGHAWASVEGTWDVLGTETVKVSAKGHSQSAKVSFSDEFTFSADGSFEMLDVNGSWTQKKKKFTVYLDADGLAQFFANTLSQELGYDVSITVTKMTFTGSEQKNGTIKGSFKWNMTFYIVDYDVSGKVTVSGSFKGTPQAAIYTSSVNRQESFRLNSIFDAIKEELSTELNNTIQSEWNHAIICGEAKSG